MSWDAWAERMIEKGAHHCGIHGQGDGNAWASKNMCVSACEVQELEQTIKTKNMSIFANGVKLGGEKWLPISLDDNVLIMRGKDPSNKEKTMTVCLSKTAVVLGANENANTQGNKVRSAVEEIKFSLENSGL